MSTLKTKLISAPINGGTVEPLVLQTNNLDRVTVSSSGDVTFAENLTASKQATVSGLALLNGETRLGSKLGLGGANYGTSGQVLTSQGSSSAPVWANAGGMDLLGTLTTTSGTTHTLSGLNLTGYRLIAVSLNTQHSSGTATPLQLNGSSVTTNAAPGLRVRGLIWIDLLTGTATTGASTTNTAGGGSFYMVYNSGAINSSTSVGAFTWASGTGFTGGSITIYGVK